jgi:glycosyltransferase involved in cell wall biosynthesis
LGFSVLPAADQPIRLRFEYTRYPHWGGRSGYVRLVHYLDRAHFRTYLHGASDSDADLPRLLAPFKPALRRFVHRGGMPWYKLSDLTAELGAFAACLARRCDIVHFLDGEHSGQFLPRLLKWARLLSVRTIATFHQPPIIAKDLLNPVLLRQLDQIVLVSPSQLAYFKLHADEDRLHVILHGVETDFFHPPSRPNATQQIRCITAGHWLRDWDTFRTVASAMPQIGFDVVSDRIPTLGGLSNVRVHCGIDDGALAELYRRGDVLFLPLRQSTANNCLLEGIASGLPVVATDLAAVRAYLSDGEGILVAPNHPQGFADALRLLQNDPGLRAAMGRRARVRAEALAWPRLVGKYEQLYKAALDRAPVGR